MKEGTSGNETTRRRGGEGQRGERYNLPGKFCSHVSVLFSIEAPMYGSGVFCSFIRWDSDWWRLVQGLHVCAIFLVFRSAGGFPMRQCTHVREGFSSHSGSLVLKSREVFIGEAFSSKRCEGFFVVVQSVLVLPLQQSCSCSCFNCRRRVVHFQYAEVLRRSTNHPYVCGCVNR